MKPASSKAVAGGEWAGSGYIIISKSMILYNIDAATTSSSSSPFLFEQVFITLFFFSSNRGAFHERTSIFTIKFYALLLLSLDETQ